MTDNRAPLSVKLFGTGCLIGLAMVFFDSFWLNSTDLHFDEKATIAVVNGQPILRADYETLIEMLASDKRNRLEPSDRSHALQRLIDEELLIQEGIALGLTERDTTVRKAISAAMIGVSRLEFSTTEPTYDALFAFYKNQQDRFIKIGPMLVRRYIGKTEAATLNTAELDLNRDDPINPIATGPLSPKVLRGYIGPTALNAVLALDVGTMTKPLPHGSGFQIIKLIARQQNYLPAFATIKDTVLFEYTRQRDEKALSDFIIRLRDKAAIEIMPERRK